MSAIAAIGFGTGAVYALLFLCLYFEVFLLVSFLEGSSRAKHGPITKKNPSYQPKVAIVVPCYNEAKTIGGTLRSLQALHYPADKLEIIVVDDGSTDDTYTIARQFESASIRVFHKGNGGKHSAMNFALERTDAELIGCLDADSIVDKNALREIAPIFENEKIAAVTPGIHVHKPETLLQHIQNVEYQLSLFNRFVFAALGSVFITPGPFSIFRAKVVRELGGWRYAHSTEDMEMALRIQSAGHLIANAPRAVVHTNTPRTLKALFRQRVRWTYGWLRNAADYRSMLGNRAFGNLGMIILPWAMLSIGAGIYFFARIVYYSVKFGFDETTRLQIMGLHPHFGVNTFYINTSAVWLLVLIAVGLIFALICIGSQIGTGSRRPPSATPLFLLFYSFLTPMWLITAVVRAVFKTGVQWR